MLWLFHLACRAQCNPLCYETTKNAVAIPNYSCKSSLFIVQQQQQQQQQSSCIHGITSLKMLFQWTVYVTKIFRETTLMLKIYLYIKKIYPTIYYTKINQP